MILKKKKAVELTPEQKEKQLNQSFFDRISPSIIKFYADHYICGNFYGSVWAIREYAPIADEQALLSHIADHENVTLHIYNRAVTMLEQRQITQSAARRNSATKNSSNDIVSAIDAQGNLDDIATMLNDLRENKEGLLHTAVFIQLKASSHDKLVELQADIQMELTRAKISYDRLLLQQKEGFLSALPFGRNNFNELFERVMPVSSSANLYPLNYSGKTDKKGIYIGKDKFGSSICVDFDKRSEDKTNSNILILGNSGEGKSYLIKLIMINTRESGFDVITIDANEEYTEIVDKLGGVTIDLLGGEYIINPLEPIKWATSSETSNVATFNKTAILNQHISYLKDFFRTYKDFTDAEIDTIELMLEKLYKKFDIRGTDLSHIPHDKYPLLSDLYSLIEEEYNSALEEPTRLIYKPETLQSILLGLNSICRGAESKYFNGYTNIRDGRIINFLVKGIMDTNDKLRNTIMFNLLSYVQHKLLTQGRTFAFIDELHLFLSNITSVGYLRTIMKQDRHADSGLVLATQNVEDLLLPNVKELTKPLLSIPTHQFLFFAGVTNKSDFIDALQLEEAEYKLISKPSRGHCLYRCGNERYLLKVIAPEHKQAIIGSSGGR